MNCPAAAPNDSLRQDAHQLIHVVRRNLDDQQHVERTRQAVARSQAPGTIGATPIQRRVVQIHRSSPADHDAGAFDDRAGSRTIVHRLRASGCAWLKKSLRHCGAEGWIAG
jgi:hypothetical protein